MPAKYAFVVMSGLIVTACAGAGRDTPGLASGRVETPGAAGLDRRQFHDERTGRYYYYDPTMGRYYWEDGRPRG